MRLVYQMTQGKTHWQKRKSTYSRKCLILLVEMRRVELLTSALRTQRSAKLSYIPKTKFDDKNFTAKLSSLLNGARGQKRAFGV